MIFYFTWMKSHRLQTEEGKTFILTHIFTYTFNDYLS